MLNYYHIYGFTLRTNIEFRQLVPLGYPTPFTDLSIMLGTKPIPETLDSEVIEEEFYNGALKMFFNGRDVLLHYPEQIKVLIKDASEIHVSVAHGTSLDSIKQVLLQGVIGICMLLKKKFALHGCAIETASGAVIFIGNSGAGKSTLAGACHLKGYSILSDDISRVKQTPDGSYHVIPSYPMVKLLPDSADSLGYSAMDLHHHPLIKGKFELLLNSPFSIETQPIKGIYWLNTDDGIDTMHIDELFGGEKLKALLQNVYRNFMIGTLGLPEAHFQFCMALAQKVPVFNIKRPAQGFYPNQIIEEVLTPLSKE